MSRKKKSMEVDTDYILQLMKSKGLDYVVLANKMKLDKSTIRRKIVGEIPMMENDLAFLSMILDCTEEDLIKKPQVAKGQSMVEDIVKLKELESNYERLADSIDFLGGQIVAIAKVIADVQKVTNETKAHCELLQDEVNNISSKCFSISNTVNKISGWINAKYRANNK